VSEPVKPSFPLRDGVGAVKKFVVASMEISILQRATGCGNAMCNARNVTGKGLPPCQLVICWLSSTSTMWHKVCLKP
jgi:hypothetical protein